MLFELSFLLPGLTSVAWDVPTCLWDLHLLLELIQREWLSESKSTVEEDGLSSVQWGGFSLGAASGHLGTWKVGFPGPHPLWILKEKPMVCLGASPWFSWSSVCAAGAGR